MKQKQEVVSMVKTRITHFFWLKKPLKGIIQYLTYV